MRGLKIFGLSYFSYLLIALYANYFNPQLRDILYSRGFVPSYLVWGTAMALLFFAVFALGYLSDLPLPPMFIAAVALVVSLYDFPPAFLVVCLLLLAYKLDLDLLRRFSSVAIALSLAIPPILYVLNGVPLLDPSLRYELVGPLVLLALLGALGMSYSQLPLMWKTVLLGAYTVVFLLGSFRSLVALIYIVYLLDVYFTDINPLRHKTAIAGVLAALFLIVLWMSGGINVLLIRVGFTFLVFHNLVRLALPFGLFHGMLLFSDNPRYLVGQLFGTTTHYTYFFFGQAVADFGILGIIEAFFLGILLRRSEDSLDSMTLALSVMVYALDSGIDAMLLLFILAAVLFSKPRAGTQEDIGEPENGTVS